MHKADFEACDKLLSADSTQVVAVLPQLLCWLQDINWPVAPYIIKRLSQLDAVLAGPVLVVLGSNDEMWKYWIISNLLPFATAEVCHAVYPRIKEIAVMPTKSEVSEEVNLVAAELLLQWHDANI